MTRLAVLADLHADDFGNRIDRATGKNARYVEVLDMASWVVEDARARGCEALVVAGDLTEKKESASWRADDIAKRLSAFPGPVMVIRGNHDKEVAGSSIVTLLGRQPRWYGYAVSGVLTVGDTAIAMVPYIDTHQIRSSREEYATAPPAVIYAALSEMAVNIARGLYVLASGSAKRTVLIMHQGLSGASLTEGMQSDLLAESSMVVSTPALASIGFDAVLAGHYHRHQVIRRDPIVAYAGSPHRVDHGEEAETKGYVIYDTDDPVGLTFVETPCRRFVTLRGDCGYAPADIADAVVRCLDVDPEIDRTQLKRALLADGAYDVKATPRPVERPASVGGIAESASPDEALCEYVGDDPDREALLELGRELLAEAAA